MRNSETPNTRQQLPKNHFSESQPLTDEFTQQIEQFPHVNAEEAGHAVQVVLISGHRDDLRNDGLLGPFRAELINGDNTY